MLEETVFATRVSNVIKRRRTFLEGEAKGTMKGLLFLAAVLALVTLPARSAELQRVTLDAWQDYLRAARVRVQTRLDADKSFLWIDENTERRRRVLRGEVVAEPAIEHGTKTVPNGLIHDWIGAAFLPNATVDSLLSVVRDYDRYREIYNPAVTESHSLGNTPAGEDFSMTWQRRVLCISAATQGWYRARNFTLDPRRGYSTAEATRIQQIEDYRHHNERLLPPDTGSGFIWRVYSIVRYEQRDGGVYLEIEAIVLTRDIPPSVAWLVTPIVTRLSIDSLATTIQQTLRAARGVTPSPLAMR